MKIKIELLSADNHGLELNVERNFEVFGEEECSSLKRDIYDYIHCHPDYMYFGYEIIDIRLVSSED